MNEKTGKIIRLVLLLVFFFMFLYGMTTKEMAEVLLKAKNICMECIGIG